MTTQPQRSILEFSLSTEPAPRSLMGILRAFADESGKESDTSCRCISMGAVIGEVGQWQTFNEAWAAMCDYHQIPYLHMKEVIGAQYTKKGPFARFNDFAKLDELMNNIVWTLRHSGVFCCAMSIWLDDLKVSMKRHGLKGDPYSFSLYQIVVSMGTWALNKYPDDPSFHLVLDRLEKGTKKIADAERLYETDQFASWRGWPAVTALRPKDGQGSREIRELQAADFVAWLLRYNLISIQWWLRNVKPKIGPNRMEGWSRSLSEWLKERSKVLEETNPLANLFTSTWMSLGYWDIIKFYPYDEERIENHIMNGRTGIRCDPYLQKATIDRAGLFPLSP